MVSDGFNYACLYGNPILGQFAYSNETFHMLSVQIVFSFALFSISNGATEFPRPLLSPLSCSLQRLFM